MGDVTNTKHRLIAHDPFSWLKQAEDLDRAAMLIWNAMREDLVKLSKAAVGSAVDCKQVPYANIGGVFWLNAGFALENLLKGIIVQNDPTSIVNGTITASLKMHNLLGLAKRAAVSLDPTEAYYLFVGTECIMWAGRYPCSTTPDQPVALVFSEADVLAYRSLFEQLSARFIGCEGKRVTLHRLA